MKLPYLTFLASRRTMTLWWKSSLIRRSQAPASTRVCSISTPGITGKDGKWSARYSSPRVKFLTMRIERPGTTSRIRSTRWNRMVPSLTDFCEPLSGRIPLQEGKYIGAKDTRQPRIRFLWPPGPEETQNRQSHSSRPPAHEFSDHKYLAGRLLHGFVAPDRQAPPLRNE